MLTRGAGGGGHGGHGDRIRGRTTLAEAAALAGVTAQELAEALKLPPDTPGDERLGHLRQDHGLSMQDVRAAVTKLAGEKQE